MYIFIRKGISPCQKCVFIQHHDNNTRDLKLLVVKYTFLCTMCRVLSQNHVIQNQGRLKKAMRNSKTYNTILKLHPEALSSTLEEKKAQISEVLLFLFLATSHNMMCVESKKLGLMRAKKAHPV